MQNAKCKMSKPQMLRCAQHDMLVSPGARSCHPERAAVTRSAAKGLSKGGRALHPQLCTLHFYELLAQPGNASAVHTVADSGAVGVGFEQARSAELPQML